MSNGVVLRNISLPCFFRFPTDKLYGTMPHRLYGKQIRECLLSCVLFLEAVCMTTNAGRSSDLVHLLRLPIRTNLLQWFLQQTHIFAYYIPQISSHTQIPRKYFCILSANCVNLTAAGLSGLFTRFPFNLYPCILISNYPHIPTSRICILLNSHRHA